MSRAMKDSGIPWIGNIPLEWNIERIKTIFSERTELSEEGNEDLLSVSEYYGVDKRAGRVEDGDYISRSESLIGYKKCYKGDFVSNIMLAWKGSLGVTNYDGVVSPAYCVYKPNKGVCPQYYHYLFRTSLYTGRFKCFSKGIIDSRLRLYSPYFFDIDAIIPPVIEQQAIADFLDKKCSEIDELIALQEKIIEELKAYKQSIITEAVTKGLNPNVPMKDSGIEWIGKIPQHWDEVRFYKANYIRGRLGWKGLKAEEYVESGFPFLSAFNIVNDNIEWKNLNYINQERFDESPEIKLSVGDLLVVKDGAGIGKCAKIDHLPMGEATVNSSLAVITPNKHIYYAYQYYYMLSIPFQNIIWQVKIGMGVPHLTQENMRDIKEPCPPYNEQQAIADYLDKKCSEIDVIITIKQSKIDELKEYKKSIIYEYVTGKKEVV